MSSSNEKQLIREKKQKKIKIKKPRKVSEILRKPRVNYEYYKQKYFIEKSRTFVSLHEYEQVLVNDKLELTMMTTNVKSSEIESNTNNKKKRKEIHIDISNRNNNTLNIYITCNNIVIKRYVYHLSWIHRLCVIITNIINDLKFNDDIRIIEMSNEKILILFNYNNYLHIDCINRKLIQIDNIDYYNLRLMLNKHKFDDFDANVGCDLELDFSLTNTDTDNDLEY